MGISVISHCQACQAVVNTQWPACLVCHAPIVKPEGYVTLAASPSHAPASVPPGPKFNPSQQVWITDNLNRVRSGVIQFADWVEEPLTAKGWWYCILDVYGGLSQTHESRLSETGLMNKN